MINPKHIEIRTMEQFGSGGQHVGVIEAGVSVKHLPTEITASCRSQPSQQQNLKVALSMIEWGLAEIGFKE